MGAGRLSISPKGDTCLRGKKMRKFHSTLDTDLFTRRKYEKLRNKSKKIKEMESEGKKDFESYPHLLGDVWSGLYQSDPQMSEGKINKQAKLNKPLMEKLLQDPKFQGLREYTKLDDLGAALGAVNMGDHLSEFVKTHLQEAEKERRRMEEARKQVKDLQKQLKEQQKQNQQKKDEDQQPPPPDQNQSQSQPQQQPQQADQQGQNGQQQSQQSGPGPRHTSPPTEQQLKQQIKKMENKAKKHEKQMNQKIEQKMQDGGTQKALSKAVGGATQETKQDAKNIQTVTGGGYGTESGDPSTMTPEQLGEAVELADKLKNDYRLRKIADIAGRFSEIVKKKKRKTEAEGVEPEMLDMGSDLQNLSEEEVMLLDQCEEEFLRKYTEESLQRYSPNPSKGKGPIVVCIDTSGSMQGLDPEAKAAAIAFMRVAIKEKRSFAVVNFAYASQVKTWEFPNPTKIKPDDVLEVASHFWSGGTNFDSPLWKATRIMDKSSFQKGDIVFITDGQAPLSSKDQILKLKAKKKFEIFAVQLCQGLSFENMKKRDKKDLVKSMVSEALAEISDEIFVTGSLKDIEGDLFTKVD